jgi:hypothetical protein
MLDEAYYLLSYKMAAEGFFNHFTNAPFLTAYFFQSFNPSIIEYRLIHLTAYIASTLSFVYTVIRFVNANGYSLSKADCVLLNLFALMGSLFCYSISIPTLSYNHLNQIFILLSLSFLLLALANKKNKKHLFYFFLAGAFLLVDFYIKPPTFIAILLLEIFVVYFSITTLKKRLEYISAYLIGGFLSFILITISFYPLSQWSEYFDLISQQKSHAPLKVMYSFIISGLEMLKTSSGFILSSIPIIIIFSKLNFLKKHLLCQIVLPLIVALNCYFAYILFFPSTIWASFNLHYWYWSIYSSTILVAIIAVCFIFGVGIVLRRKNPLQNPLFLLFIILALTPTAL